MARLVENPDLAFRLARAIVSDIALYNQEKVKEGIKEDTILRWLREAAQHAEQVEDVLMEQFHLKRAQVDGLWSYVRNKGEKKLSRNG